MELGKIIQYFIVSLYFSPRFEVSSYRSVPREYTVQMETEEEREALIINPSEHVIVRKVSEWKTFKNPQILIYICSVLIVYC